MKESFVFYHEWAEAIKDLPDKERLEIYEAIIEYAETGKTPELSGTAKVAFGFIKPQLDRNAGKYEAKVERMAKARSKINNQTNISQKSDSNQSNNRLKSDRNQTDIRSDNVNDNVNVNVNDNVNDNVNVNVNGSGGGNDNVQAPPTTDLAPEDIFSYFEEIGSKADPQRFIDYYGLEALSNMNWRKVADQWKQTQFTRKPKSDTLYEELMKWAKE